MWTSARPPSMALKHSERSDERFQGAVFPSGTITLGLAEERQVAFGVSNTDSPDYVLKLAWSVTSSRREESKRDCAQSRQLGPLSNSNVRNQAILVKCLSRYQCC